MREQLRGNGVPDTVVDDAVLILSELLSNACRHGRPLEPLDRQAGVGDGGVRAAWRVDPAGELTVEVTDGGGPTRPVPSTPSVTARGGRGLNIISALAREWGVRDGTRGEVTVWALVSSGHGRASQAFTPRAPAAGRHGSRGLSTVGSAHGLGPLGGLGPLEGLGPLDGLGFADALDAFDDAG